MKREKKSEDEIILRQIAEGLMKKKPSKKVLPLSEFEVMKLVHELEVHQIELELQNEELFLAKEKIAEKANEKYAELYDFAPSAYFTLSAAGNIVELNIRGSQMLGKDRSLLKKRRFDFFISDDTKLVFNGFLCDVFNNKTRQTCELTLCPNGCKPIYIHMVGIATENGEQCMLNAVDITDRKQTEQVLKENEEKYRFLFHNNPQPMYIFDINTFEFLEVNNAAVEHYGYSREEFLSMTLMDIRPTEDIDALVRDVEQAKKPYNPVGEWRHIKKSGEEIFVEITSHSLVFNGRNARHVLAHDITERKRAEEEIQHKNEELQRINAEKDKFFSIIAHDLRSPFNGFLGLTEIMAEDISHMTMEEVQSIAVVMRSSATNLFRLLGNLLEWSRMQRGLTTFEPVVFSLMPKLSESAALAIDAANKKKIAISFDIPENLRVFADCQMFGGIVRNLMTNAVKFTPKGGNIFVSAKSVPNNFVEISIKDNGIGMNQNMIDNLFRLDVNTSRKGTEGEASTGLGLIICNDFIKKNKGELWIESEEYKGSTFRFTLPEKAEKKE